MTLYLMSVATVFHLYVYWKLRAAFGSGRWSLFFFGTLAFFIVLPLTRYYELFDSNRFFEITFALTITEYIIVGMICTVLVLTDILRIILCLWDKARKTNAESLFSPRIAAVFSLAFVSCIVVYGYYEAWNVRKVHIVISSHKLPENTERLRVVQISDIHIGGVYPIRHLERVMEMVRAAEPDIFVVTGDLVDGNMTHRSREAKLISAHGAKYGSFAIAGNHEHIAGLDQAFDFFERCGLTFLDDQMTETAGITIIGLDDMTTFWPFRQQTPQDRFVLLLKHRQNVMKSSLGKFDLQLCGHTHGGQIWPLGFLHQKLQGYTQGLSKTGESFVYVSNGTGYWAPPIRFLTPPEVTVIDIVNPEKGLNPFPMTNSNAKHITS